MISRKLELTRKGHKRITLGKSKRSAYSLTEVYLSIGAERRVLALEECRELRDFLDYLVPPRPATVASTFSTFSRMSEF